MDWSHRKDTVYTPQKEFADITGLNSLPPVKLDLSSSARQEGTKGIVTATVKNPSTSVAFQVHFRVTKGQGGDDLVPIFWDDNYFSLLPGEEKTVSATYDASDAEGKSPVLELDGYNVVAATASPSH
jgi:exo-1,4-beta-D-glucosaminidase